MDCSASGYRDAAVVAALAEEEKNVLPWPPEPMVSDGIYARDATVEEEEEKAAVSRTAYPVVSANANKKLAAEVRGAGGCGESRGGNVRG